MGKKKHTRRNPIFFIAKLAFILALVFIFLFSGCLLFSNRFVHQKNVFLIVADRPVLAAVDFTSKRLKLVDYIFLPGDVEIKAARGYGNFKLESIYKLGAQEEIGGGKLLAESLNASFGIPIEGWLDLKSAKMPKIFGKSWLLAAFRKAFFGRNPTNLSAKDLLFWWFTLLKAGRVEYRVHDLKSDDLLSRTLVENRIVTKLNGEKLKQMYGWVFSDSELESEGYAIAVLNGCGHPGLASAAKRIIQGMGGRVVLLSDYEKEINQCLVESRKGVSGSATSLKLAKIFGCQIIEKDMRQEYRADIVLILGAEYSKRMGE